MPELQETDELARDYLSSAEPTAWLESHTPIGEEFVWSALRVAGFPPVDDSGANVAIDASVARRCTMAADRTASYDLRGEAHVFLGLGLQSTDPRAAATEVSTAAELFGLAGKPERQGGCYWALGDSLRKMHELRAAKASYHAALQLMTQLEPAGKANLLWALGGVEQDLGEMGSAENHLKEALQGGWKDGAVRAGVLSRLHALLSDQGRLAEWSAMNDAAVGAVDAILASPFDWRRAAQDRFENASDRAGGDPQAALAESDALLDEAEAHRDLAFMMSVLLFRSDLLGLVGRSVQAEEDAQRAGELAHELGDREVEGVARLRAADARVRRDKVGALEFAREALDILRALPSRKGAGEAALFLVRFADDSDPTTRGKLLAEAFECYSSSDYNLGLAHCFMFRGSSYVAQRMWKEAWSDLIEARRRYLLQQNFIGAVYVQCFMAEVQFEVGERDKAIEGLEVTLKNMARKGLDSSAPRLEAFVLHELARLEALSSASVRAYEHARRAIQNYAQSPAEQSLDDLAIDQEQAGDSCAIAATAAANLSELHQFGSVSGSAERDLSNAKLWRHRAWARQQDQHAFAVARLFGSGDLPDYSVGAKSGSVPNPLVTDDLEMSRVAALLDQRNALLITFTQADGAFFATVLCGDGALEYIKLDEPSQTDLQRYLMSNIGSAAAQHRFEVGAEYGNTRGDLRSEAWWHHLWSQIWTPIARTGRLKGDYLIYISAHGLLSRLPFAALERPGAEISFFAEQYASSYLLHPRLLTRIADSGDIAQQSLVAVLNPATDIGLVGDSARVLDVTIRLGYRSAGAQTRRDLLESISDSSGLVFFGHAELGGLKLADGILSARDLRDSGIHARGAAIVIACGLGMAHGAAEYSADSIVTALHYVGYSTVLVPMWRVRARTGAAFLEHFLGGGNRSWPRRLQDLQVRAIRGAIPELVGPANWAAFTVHG